MAMRGRSNCGALAIGGALVGLLAFCALAGAARAAGVALIEEVSKPRPGLEAMDTLASGQMIALGAGERLVVNYLASCLRETIVGGVVSIGTEASTVVGGKVTREKVECDGGKTKLSAGQAASSGVMVFRGGKLLKPAADAAKPN
jgi:hypothetical protein